MILSNPLANPIFGSTLQVVVELFVSGLGLTLFFGRQDLRRALTGELGQRYLSWLIIAPLFLLAVFAGGIVALVILLASIVQLVREYVRVTGLTRVYARYLYAAIPYTLLIAAFFPTLFFALPALALFTLTFIPILSQRVDETYQQVSYAGRGYLFLVWSCAHMVLIRQLDQGLGWLLVAGMGAALSDVGAFTVGKLIGRHVISPPVNPRKAWEGLLGNALGAALVVTLLRFALPETLSALQLILLALLIGLSSAWGDLSSSLLKRAANVKDWGQLLPGHGGLLDRANSFVIVLPVVYYYAALLAQSLTKG